MLERILEPEVMDTWKDAVEYDAMDFTEVNTAFAVRALELGPKKGRVLDLGTGTARIPILMLERNRDLRVVAIDYSKNMLEIGRKNVEEARFQKKIDLRHADAKNLSYRRGHFDFVISNSLVHHLPDPLPFFKEVRRVAKPRAGILIRDLIRPPNVAVMESLVQQYVINCNDHQKKLFHDSLHAALTIDEVKKILREAELHDLTVVQSSDRHWSIERKYGKK